MNDKAMQETIEFYRSQGAPQDQQMLVALLREVQEADGGVLSQKVLSVIAGECGVKETMLQALIRRIPDLRSEQAPHRLEVCGTCKVGAKLRDYIEQTYRTTKDSRFSYHIVPCMKNCKNGPSIRWDGKLYSHANASLIDELVGKA